MKYNGIELKEFTSDKPILFDPPKKMLVWDKLSITPIEKLVDAYIPSHNSPVISQYSNWAYCAEIPKARRATNRELIKWLAQGNGVCRYCPGSKVQSYAEYYENTANYKCNSSWRIRKWEDTEWHEPTADYLGLDSLTDKAIH